MLIQPVPDAHISTFISASASPSTSSDGHPHVIHKRAAHFNVMDDIEQSTGHQCLFDAKDDPLPMYRDDPISAEHERLAVSKVFFFKLSDN